MSAQSKRVEHHAEQHAAPQCVVVGHPPVQSMCQLADPAQRARHMAITAASCCVVCVQRVEARLTAFRRLSQPKDMRLYASRAEANTAIVHNNAAMRGLNHGKPALAAAQPVVAKQITAEQRALKPASASTPGNSNAVTRANGPNAAVQAPGPVPHRIAVLVNGSRRQMLLRHAPPPGGSAKASSHLSTESHADRAPTPDVAECRRLTSGSGAVVTDVPAAEASGIRNDSNCQAALCNAYSKLFSHHRTSSGVQAAGVQSAEVAGRGGERIIVHAVRRLPNAAGTITGLPSDPDLRPRAVIGTAADASELQVQRTAHEWIPPHIQKQLGLAKDNPPSGASCSVHLEDGAAASVTKADRWGSESEDTGSLIMPVLEHSASDVLSMLKNECHMCLFCTE
jgi:hypothetical protein